jgi:hypothetical protein
MLPVPGRQAVPGVAETSIRLRILKDSWRMRPHCSNVPGGRDLDPLEDTESLAPRLVGGSG